MTEVLDFWYTGRMPSYWFSSTPAIDDEIRASFEPLWERARAGRLVQWQASSEGALALVIVLDQFPLNMFRGHPKSFATEQQALEVTKLAVQRKLDRALPNNRLAFLYMPLMHSENLADQDLSVRLFRDAKLDDSIEFALHHREIIRRFGRFPHRNKILGRASTAAEISYLLSKNAFKG
ncbi:MAG: DUF924 domain-containing protein [Gammaproteobacteria bacterium]|nr:DUF924 domain-containing protein [Gammaproteobacteria bacterium]